MKACTNLVIEGVDLYGGTRHSSVRALITAEYTPEQVKQAAMSETNAAFARYMGKAIDQDLRAIYRRSAQVVSIGQGGHRVDKGKTRRRPSHSQPIYPYILRFQILNFPEYP
jgi:hypothetical protein